MTEKAAIMHGKLFKQWIDYKIGRILFDCGFYGT